nr:MAG TPA: hypothetical protein [Caudoviricetes sp.]
MVDRVPLYPGRVKMTPVSGQANIYDMERADQPTQAGTPLNKTTLLKDSTAALYGLTDATPDDVFQKLGDSAFSVGDIRLTNRQSIGANWALCNGDTYDAEEYPAYLAIQTAFNDLENGITALPSACTTSYVSKVLEDGAVVYREGSSDSSTTHLAVFPYASPLITFPQAPYDVILVTKNGQKYYLALISGTYSNNTQYRLLVYSGAGSLLSSTYLVISGDYLRSFNTQHMVITNAGYIVISSSEWGLFATTVPVNIGGTLSNTYTLVCKQETDSVFDSILAVGENVLVSDRSSRYLSVWLWNSSSKTWSAKSKTVSSTFLALAVTPNGSFAVIAANGYTIPFSVGADGVSYGTPVSNKVNDNVAVYISNNKTFIIVDNNDGIYSLLDNFSFQQEAANKFGWKTYANYFAIINGKYVVMLDVVDDSLISSQPGVLPAVSINGANAFVKVK